ncbi:MAG: addiction module toxin, RelE/StbE family [Rhodospirillales bacterium]|jgi:mRNA interferase YafQ|nr:addiction module toxin, RelE/StbE family [Rhodospirillales bacterium]
MRRLVYSGQFKRDTKRAEKRGKDMEKLKKLVRLLVAEEPLSPRFKDHPLKGEWVSFRDAHIEPDWVLIYKVTDDELRLERTGTHADLFDQ